MYMPMTQSFCCTNIWLYGCNHFCFRSSVKIHMIHDTYDICFWYIWSMVSSYVLRQRIAWRLWGKSHLEMNCVDTVWCEANKRCTKPQPNFGWMGWIWHKQYKLSLMLWQRVPKTDRSCGGVQSNFRFRDHSIGNFTRRPFDLDLKFDANFNNHSVFPQYFPSVIASFFYEIWCI